MLFNPPDPRRRPYPPVYRQGGRPPNRMRRQNNAFFNPNNFNRREQSFFNPYQQQPPFSERAPNHFNNIMGHVGTITKGVNMMRQVGSILSLFR
jgi:hypothetical protein